MRRILQTMIDAGEARQVAQAYLDAWRAGDNADQAAVNLIVRLRPKLTLAEPADMLSRLLAWIEVNHGGWWLHKLLEPPTA